MPLLTHFCIGLVLCLSSQIFITWQNDWGNVESNSQYSKSKPEYLPTSKYMNDGSP